jgi:hypothetical protein
VRAASDREALGLLAAAAGREDPRDVTIVWVRNTLEMGRILASENLLAGAGGRSDIEPAGEPIDWEYDTDGNFAGGYDGYATPKSLLHLA